MLSSSSIPYPWFGFGESTILVAGTILILHSQNVTVGSKQRLNKGRIYYYRTSKREREKNFDSKNGVLKIKIQERRKNQNKMGNTT